MMPQTEQSAQTVESEVSHFSIQRLIHWSTWTWTLYLLLIASIGALAIGGGTYALAHAGIAPLIYFWDNGILRIYAEIEFQYIWWAFAIFCCDHFAGAGQALGSVFPGGVAARQNIIFAGRFSPFCLFYRNVLAVSALSR